MNKFLNLALQYAKRAALHNEVPVGAVVVYQGKVIARGRNTKEKTQNVLGHAEINAIRKAQKYLGTWRLVDCEVYTTLEPCLMCMAIMQQARIKTTVYGAKDLKAGAVSLGFNLHQSKKLNHQIELVYDESTECAKILKSFFLELRRKKKQTPLRK